MIEEAEKIDIRKELVRSIVSLHRYKEFYGHVVQQLQKVFVGDNHPIKTAAVGRYPGEKFVKLYYNENYFRGLYEEQLILAMKNSEKKSKALVNARNLISGATEHEILHVVLGHLSLEFPDRQRGNIACDCVINQEIPSDRRHESWIMPDRYDLPYGKSSRWYYEQLKNNAQYKQDVKDGVFDDDSHFLWRDVGGDELAQDFLNDVVRKARDNTSEKGWNDLSDGIKETIDNLLKKKKPQIPWGRVFRNFCASSEESCLEYTMSRISRRFGTRPGTRRVDKVSVGIIIDTSGSISDLQLATFFNEVNWIWRNGAYVHIFEADTKVQKDYVFRGKFTGKVHGKGGTNLEVPLMDVASKRFDCIVYFTDFWASAINQRPRIPVLWVLSEPPDKSRWPCHWGKIVEIDVV